MTYKAGHVIKVVVGILEVDVDIFVLLTGHVDVQVLSISAPSKHFQKSFTLLQCIAKL